MRAISHIFKSGGLTDWSPGLHIFDRLLLAVASGIPVMPMVNRDYLKLVLLTFLLINEFEYEYSVTVCLCKQHIAQYCGDSHNCISISKSHRAKE